MLNRGDYWQCAYVVPKGGFDTKKAAGIAAFRGELAKLLPMEGDRAEELETWAEPAGRDRMVAPAGGGVVLRQQDAVAAANLLADPLRHSALTARHLQAVQRRRMWPTRATQRLQILIQNRVLLNALRNRPNFRAPVALRLISSIPVLRDIPGRIVGIGLRPERPNAVVFRTGATIQTR